MARVLGDVVDPKCGLLQGTRLEAKLWGVRHGSVGGRSRGGGRWVRGTRLGEPGWGARCGDM